MSNRYEINKLIDYVTEDQIRHSEQISLIESELKEIAESKKEKDKLLQELDMWVNIKNVLILIVLFEINVKKSRPT